MIISIIIPTFNGLKLLEKNLPLVLQSLGKTKEMIEVIIVDDGSTDASIKYLNNQKLKVLINEKNKGFAYSCNRGVKESKGEIIILLNNDVIPKKGFLEPLIRHFADKKVFAVGCKELNGEERGRGVGKFQKGFLIHKRADNQYKNNTLWVSGGSGAFRKDLFIKLGGFDEIYKPFYWEDIDLSYRGLKASFKVLFEPKSIVYHHHESTIGKLFDRIQIETISYKNSFIFVWKNITDVGLFLNHLIWLPINILKALFTGNTQFILGFLQALKLLTEILERRKKAKRLFVKNDREILKEFINE